MAALRTSAAPKLDRICVRQRLLADSRIRYAGKLKTSSNRPTDITVTSVRRVGIQPPLEATSSTIPARNKTIASIAGSINWLVLVWAGSDPVQLQNLRLGEMLNRPSLTLATQSPPI